MSKTVEIKVKKMEGFLDNLLGLHLHPEEILLFKTRFGIHTFFLKKPIDILVLNEKNTVMKIKTHLKPNSIFFWNPKFPKIIEMPEGTIKAEAIELGDLIGLNW